MPSSALTEAATRSRVVPIAANAVERGAFLARRKRRLAGLFERAPEGRIGLVVIAVARAQTRRLMQQLARKAVGLDALVPQRRLDPGVCGYAGGIVAAIPHDSLGTRVRQKPFERRQRIALPKDELAAERRNGLLQRGQRMMQPPLLRRAQRPAPTRVRLANIGGNDRAARCRGRMQSVIVVEAQILAKPQQDRVRLFLRCRHGPCCSSVLQEFMGFAAAGTIIRPH